MFLYRFIRPLSVYPKMFIRKICFFLSLSGLTILFIRILCFAKFYPTFYPTFIRNFVFFSSLSGLFKNVFWLNRFFFIYPKMLIRKMCFFPSLSGLIRFDYFGFSEFCVLFWIKFPRIMCDATWRRPNLPARVSSLSSHSSSPFPLFPHFSLFPLLS